ncbi:MAG: carbohydrate binding domain-containing protein [bacterium]
MDNSSAYLGSKSLEIVGIVATGQALHAKVRHEPIIAEGGKTFTISFWAKVDAKEGNSRPVDVSVQRENDPWPGFYNVTIILDSTDWKEYTCKVDMPGGAIEKVRVGLCVAESDIDFWIDDFKFFEDESNTGKAVNRIGKVPNLWGKIKANF